MQIHLRRNGKTTGPYSLSEVERQLSAGEIAPDTLAWHDGLAEWQPVAEIVARLTGRAPILPPPLPPPIYAGFWWRVLACLIDTLIVCLFTYLLRLLPGRDISPQDWSSLAIVIRWLYDATMESSSRQATLGKLICKLRVTDEAGKRINFGRATGRHFAKILNALTACIGFLMVAWTRRKQGLHDLLAKTLVVRR